MKITPEQVAKDQPPRLAKCLVWMALALSIVAAILRQPWGGRRADAAGSAPEPELDWREPLADQVQSHDALIAAAAEFLADLPP